MIIALRRVSWAMTNAIFTAEQYAAALARLKQKFAERRAAKADFSAMCERIATEPRSAFGEEFTLSFEEIGLELETAHENVRVRSELRHRR